MRRALKFAKGRVQDFEVCILRAREGERERERVLLESVALVAEREREIRGVSSGFGAESVLALTKSSSTGGTLKIDTQK